MLNNYISIEVLCCFNTAVDYTVEQNTLDLSTPPLAAVWWYVFVTDIATWPMLFGEEDAASATLQTPEGAPGSDNRNSPSLLMCPSTLPPTQAAPGVPDAADQIQLAHERKGSAIDIGAPMAEADIESGLAVLDDHTKDKQRRQNRHNIQRIHSIKARTPERITGNTDRNTKHTRTLTNTRTPT